MTAAGRYVTRKTISIITKDLFTRFSNGLIDFLLSDFNSVHIPFTSSAGRLLMVPLLLGTATLISSNCFVAERSEICFAGFNSMRFLESNYSTLAYFVIFNNIVTSKSVCYVLF